MLTREDTVMPEPLPFRWRDFAECLGMEVDDFYPFATAEEWEQEALFFCHRCVVRSECLEDALTVESRPNVAVWGVRGGVPEKERRKMVAKRMKEQQIKRKVAKP